MYQKPTAPRNIGGVLDDCVRMYRAGFGKTWPLALGAQLLVAVPTFFFRLRLIGNVAPSPQAVLAMYRSPAFWLTYSVCAIAAVGFYNAVTLQFSSLVQGVPCSAGESLARGYRLLPRVLVLFLTFVGCTFIIGLALGIAAAAARPAAVILAIVLGPVVIYLLGRVYLTNVALLAEDLGVFKSIETSWELTRGHWWRGATIYSVILLMAIVFYFVIGFAAGLITVAFGAASIAGAGLTEVVSVLGTTILLPLVSAALVAIYYDFKLRIEGADLASRVNALASQ